MRLRSAEGRGTGAVATACLLIAALLAAGCGGDDGERDEASSREILTARSLGIAYLEENRLERAEKQFRKLVELAPDEPLGHANLGVVHLRRGEYKEAERQIRTALELDPGDPDVRLSLARVYEETGRREKALELLRGTLEELPDHTKTLYALARLHREGGGAEARARRERYLGRIVRERGGNVAARMELAETLLRNGKTDSAAAHLEAIRRQVPELPEEGRPHFEEALRLARSSKPEEALPAALRFENYFKTTSPYQSALSDLRGPGRVRGGVPIMKLSQRLETGTGEGGASLENLRYRDVSGEAGLPESPLATDVASAGVAVADYDGDDDSDLFATSPAGGLLLQNDLGRYSDSTGTAGLEGAVGRSARFGDYDNDGSLDLYVGGSGGGRLYRNEGEGRFRDVTEETGTAATGSTVEDPLFVDFDHDGDLDLFLAAVGGNRLYRNDMDGGFTEVSEEAGLAGPAGTDSRDAAIGDFDDDKRIDLVVANDQAGGALYRNRGQGRFVRLTGEVGLEGGAAAAVAVGDYDNDGWLDLFFAGSEGGHRLYRNRGDGTFSRVDRSAGVLDGLRGLRGRDAAFLDFDNDGRLDLVLGGEASDTSAGGLAILHNEGEDGFTDVSDRVLRGGADAVHRLEAADYNEDGDLDLYVVDGEGRLHLLRNDGGDAGHFFKLQLVGLSTGSGKNNHFGIGSRVELRAGDLYQTRVVDDPTIHFGLGSHLKADVVRIRWTNGVPQNLFFPGSDRQFVEEQTLKGSCAFVYTWGGEGYSFVTDVMWRSAIGMPVGIMASSGGSGDAGRKYAPAGISEEYRRIPGEKLAARDGVYRLQVTEELWETAYFDQVRLLAVDHPDSVDVFVDERFRPPAPAPDVPTIHRAGEKRTPVAARDGRGNDVLDELRADDHVYVSSLEPGRYQGITEMHDLVLDLGDVTGAEEVKLFLNGWVYPTDASINVAVAQSDSVRVAAPVLQVPAAGGGWRTVIDDLSFPAGKNKTLVADLTGLLPEHDARVRLRTNMEVYWDHAFFTTADSRSPVRITRLRPTAADLHDRGFSREYRKGGRFGPHWFDYDDVSKEPRWPRIEGRFTRYGDVLALLQEPDDRYVVMAPGDEVTLAFDADAAPGLPEGWSRDFLLYTAGWIKDADLNTAAGQTVAPLPFHDMSGYPYGPDESYPSTPEHRRYLERYQTREVRRRGPVLRDDEMVERLLSGREGG